MPDITMCTGGICSVKNACYRYRAIPSMRQSYFAKPPVKTLPKGKYLPRQICDHLIPILPQDRLYQLPADSPCNFDANLF
jgi:hypothetical protein